MTDVTRRAVLVAAAGVGAAGVLAACGGDDSGGNSQPGAATATGPLAKTSDIPVGGGKVFARQKVVVTQPAAGEFKAFTATCTHQSCTVSKVENNTISCPCHGSEYSAQDGSVTSGPAPRALAAKDIQVEGDSISLV
jgi:Rieske Fe-S protein